MTSLVLTQDEYDKLVRRITMLGLFQYSYDYHEWEYLVAVSEDENKLIEKAKELDSRQVLIREDNLEEHYILRDKEKLHFMIKRVEVL